MSDDNWLQSVRKKWSKQDGECSDFLHYLTDHQEVPGPVPDEPCVTEFGKYYLTLSWRKPLRSGGAPIMAYRVEKWLVGGTGAGKWIEVGMTPTTSLDVYNLNPGERYDFRVTARNQYGWGEPAKTGAPIAFENVTEFPEFERCLPGELKVLFDTTAELECQVKHGKGVEIEWSKDGKTINDDSKYDIMYRDGRCCLNICNLNDEDSGRYVCEAANKHGKVCTFVRLMVVHDQRIVNANLRLNRLRQENDGKIDMAPLFSMRLRNRRVQMCYPVRLTCQVRGYPRPSVVWYRDGNSIEENQYFSIHEEADDFHSIEINNTKPEHSGTYSIVASNSSGTVSCKCELVVDKGLRTYMGPKFVDKLDRVYSVQEGSQLRLRAVVCAYPAVGVTWQKNGVCLRQSRRIIVTVSHEGEVELTIAQMKQHDSGIYTCTAINEAGSAETNTRIEVYPKQRASESEKHLEESDALYSKEPKFLVKPRSFKVAEGDHVVIDCKIIGDPKPTVIWQRDRLKLDYYRDFDEFKISNEESAAPFDYKLEIARVKFDHTGAYTITAANEHGEIKAVVSLQVYSKDPTKSSPMKDDKMKHSEVQIIPKIKRHLSDIECCDGDSVTFECEAETDGDSSDINFHWYRNGKLIPLGNDFQSSVNGNTASLIIEQVYAEDEGQYSCIVSNELGTATSTACLIVNVPEEKENQIHSQLQKPSNLQSRSKSPVINYLVPPGRDSVSSERATQKSKATAGVARFQTVPSSKVVEEGETVRFQCTVVGNPVPATAWDKYNVPIKTNGRLRVREQDDLRILEIADVTIDDEGLYRVTIENEHGRSEATARLDIINHRRRHLNSVDNRTYEKHYGRHSVGKVANVGGTCAISCGIPDASSNGSAAWYKNGETLTLSPKVVSSYRDSAYQLQLSALSLEDSGVYTCIVENDSGKTRCSAELIVLSERNEDDMNLKPPVFTKGIPQKLYAKEGKGFELRVKLQGEQPMQVRWFKNDEHVPDCNDFEYVNYDEGEYGLRFQDAFLADSGLYRCEAYNCHGDAQTMGHLIVKDATNGDETDLIENGVCSSVENFHEIQATNGKLDAFEIPGLYNSGYKMNGDSTPATFIEGPCDRMAMRGESVALTAKYFGNPEPNVTWMKAGREITPNGRISLNTKNGESVLRFETVTGDDCGKYEISVENNFGVDTRTTSLAVEGPPEAPNGQPNVVVNDRSATVTWCSPPYDGGSKITGYSIEMRSYSNSHWRKVVENCNSFFCTVRGLEPGESYIFRVRAENIHGSSGPSAESIPAYITHADLCSPTDPVRVVIQSGEVFANQFETLEELGKGRYGTVHRVRDKEHGSIHAAKFARCIKSSDKEKVREEINIMNALRHPKLLQLIAAYENNREIIILTEYISGGELFERVVADDFTLTERDCILFMRQICEGVAYIHKHNVVHLDLKPENIMCVSWDSHQIKLIDFGLAQRVTPDTRALNGTPEFIPPEIINYEPIGTETDMWSVGVICYVLLSGLSPFMGNNIAETFANIIRAEYDFNDEAFCTISQDAKDFISALLIKRKEKRLTAKQCLHHKWLAQQDKTMSCVKLCTDKLKKFIIRQKWQKTGNAIRAISRMAMASRRSSSANSSSSNSSRVSVSGASGTSEVYSSRMSSLGEDDNVLLNNGHNVDVKIATGDDSCDADQKSSLATPVKVARKSVAFVDIETSDDEKATAITENGKLSKLEKPILAKWKNLNGESGTKRSTLLAKVGDANEADVSKKNSAPKILTPSGSSVSEMIGRLKESSSKSTKVSASSTAAKTIGVSSSLKNSNNYFGSNQKSAPAKPSNGDVSSNGNVSRKVELAKTESKSKCVDVNQNIRKIVETSSSAKGKTSLGGSDATNKTCKLSDTVTAKTAERLKKFEQLSSTPSAGATPSKSKKETPVSTNKSNFEKAYAFWNRE